MTAVATTHFLLLSPLQKVWTKMRRWNPWAWLKLQNLIKSVPSTHPWQWIKSVLMWSFLPMHKFSSHCNQIKNLTAQVVREDVLPGILLSTFFKQIYIAPLLIIWRKWVCERKHISEKFLCGTMFDNVIDIYEVVGGRWCAQFDQWWRASFQINAQKRENVFEPFFFFFVAVHHRGWI